MFILGYIHKGMLLIQRINKVYDLCLSLAILCVPCGTESCKHDISAWFMFYVYHQILTVHMTAKDLICFMFSLFFSTDISSTQLVSTYEKSKLKLKYQPTKGYKGQKITKS